MRQFQLIRDAWDAEPAIRASIKQKRWKNLRIDNDNAYIIISKHKMPLPAWLVRGILFKVRPEIIYRMYFLGRIWEIKGDIVETSNHSSIRKIPAWLGEEIGNRT